MANVITVTKNYIPQIDYVSRDYTAILADLTAIAKQFNPTWAVSDPADISVALLETFAYLGDILSFYTDRMASEGFIGTASQRSSVLQIANMLGYTPTPSSAATVTLSITNKDTANSVTIPALTQVASTTDVSGQSTQVIFETDTDLTLAAGATGTVTSTQGVTTSNEALGTSNGIPNQLFKLSQTNVIINSTGSNISVSVGNYVYTYTSSLVDNNPYDSVFTTTMDADGYTYVVFGDGVGGKIPPATYGVTATYRVGVGADGNVAAGSISALITGSYSVSISQPNAASGGANDESTDSIRYNTPRALRTLRRAVSLKDYAYLALQVSGVAKSNADASVWSAVNLYIAPFGTSAVNTYGPFTNIASVSGPFAIDGSAYSSGTSYLKYTATTTGAFAGLVANSSYVTVSGAAPVAYNIYSPTMVTYVDGTNTFFTVATSYTAFPTFSSSLSSGMSISATGSNTTAFNTLKTSVTNYFTDKVAPNVTLTISPPAYVPVNIDMTLHVLPQYNQASVVTQVQSALASLVSYNNAFFADRIPPHFILNAITNIDGVDYGTVEHLRRASNEQVFSVKSWTRTAANTVTLVTTNTHNIISGQTIRLYNVGSSIDGTYGVASVTGTGILISVPTGTVSATGVTCSTLTSGVSVLPVSSTTGISVGMTITGTGISSGTTVTAVNTGGSTITLSQNVGSVASGATLTFFFSPTASDNYVKVVGVDSTTSAGITTYGVVCAVNEIPTKGTFTIAAAGGLQ